MSDGPPAGEGHAGISDEVTYQGYLELSAILDAQHPLAPPELGAQVNAAEHFFIVVHQAFEAWCGRLRPAPRGSRRVLPSRPGTRPRGLGLPGCPPGAERV
jgi:hypothetical protein